MTINVTAHFGTPDSGRWMDALALTGSGELLERAQQAGYSVSL